MVSPLKSVILWMDEAIFCTHSCATGNKNNEIYSRKNGYELGMLFLDTP